MELELKENELTLIFLCWCGLVYFQCAPQSNPRIVYELKVFVAAKHTFVHHLTNMLSFRNANPGDLYVNQRVSEKRGFIYKSEGLRKLGIYM